LNRRIKLPQAFDLCDENLAGPVSKHNGEKEYPVFNFFKRRYRDIAGLSHERPAACAKSPLMRCHFAAPCRAILHTLRS
jgi:hypothetical protein